MASRWIQDAVIESTPLSTTGGHTWKAAYRLADYFSAAATHIGLDGGPQNKKINILELGAGCGYLGITVARNLPNAKIVCLTEQEEGGACDWLQHNVDLNINQGLPLEAVRVQPCDWLQYCPQEKETTKLEEEEDAVAVSTPETQSLPPPLPPPSPILNLEKLSWDFIIGSDLIYNKIGSTCLPRVLSALSTSQTQIIYCHTKHRFDLLDIEFFENLSAVGLKYEEVWEPDALEERPPESPPLQFPPLDLFPEQRIAVFKITRM